MCPEAHAALTGEELRMINAYWRAANYLAVGMIYLRANPLLCEPLSPDHCLCRSYVEGVTSYLRKMET